MNITHADRILKTTRALRVSLMAVISHVDELSDLIERLPLDAFSAPLPLQESALHLDRATYSVRWEARSCFLGYTMAFRLLERLARQPNVYVSTDRLLGDLWEATRTSSTVRSTVCGLKAKLRAAGMNKLADMIDGSTPGHYGLFLSRG